jgi:hypothetical protein
MFWTYDAPAAAVHLEFIACLKRPVPLNGCLVRSPVGILQRNAQGF